MNFVLYVYLYHFIGALSLVFHYLHRFCSLKSFIKLCKTVKLNLRFNFSISLK